MNKTITGYQYSPTDGHFTSEYSFPNNMDKEEIHLPPFTTLTAPPRDVPIGMWAVRKGEAWVLEEDNDPNTKLVFPEIPLGDLMPDFIEDMKRANLYDRMMAFYKSRPDLSVSVKQGDGPPDAQLEAQ